MASNTTICARNVSADSANIASLTLSSSDTTNPTLTLQNTNDDANGGILAFRKDPFTQTVASDTDTVGIIKFISNDESRNDTTYGSITSAVVEADGGKEAGSLSFKVAIEGSEVEGLLLEGPNTSGTNINATIGSGVLSSITIPGSLNYYGSAPLSTAFFQSLHAAGETGTCALTATSPGIQKIAQVFFEQPSPLGAAVAISTPFSTTFNRLFGSTLTGAGEAVIASANSNAATAAQVKRLTVTGSANVAANQLTDGARDTNVWQVYRLDGDNAGNNCTITLPAAATGDCYLIICASDYVMPDNGNTLKIIAPADIDNNSFSMNVSYGGCVSDFVGKDNAADDRLTITPAANNGLMSGLQAATDYVRDLGFIACTVTSATAYHITHVQFQNINNVASWTS